MKEDGILYVVFNVIDDENKEFLGVFESEELANQYINNNIGFNNDLVVDSVILNQGAKLSLDEGAGTQRNHCPICGSLEEKKDFDTGCPNPDCELFGF